MSDLIGESPPILPSIVFVTVYVKLLAKSICSTSRQSFLAHPNSRADEYFITHLSLSQKDAAALHQKYYRDYGLAIEGLVRHHTVDPLDFNSKVDDALPLEDILKPDAQLQKLLSDIDTSKVKLWLLTNAHVSHANRVVKLLGVDKFFEGLTYCDYAAKTLLAKPHKDMFLKAMRAAGVESFKDCYFVGEHIYKHLA
jgi:pyrimidine and pyridine-specific 5'-nucleotidase